MYDPVEEFSTNPAVYKGLLFGGLLSVTVLFRLITRTSPPLYFFLAFISAYCMAMIFRSWDQENSIFDEAFDLVPVLTIQLCSPIFLFYSSMETDFSEFSHSASSTIVYLLAFSGIVALLSAFITWPLLHFSINMTFTASLLLMVILTPKWAQYAVIELHQVQGHVRDTQMFMKFEQLCSTWLGFFLTELIVAYILLHSWPDFRAYHFVILILYKLFGAVLGAFFGILIRIPVSIAYNDITAQALIIISSVYLVHMISTLLGSSSSLAVGMFGVFLNSNKVKVSKEAEDFHLKMWEWYIFIAETIIALYVGATLGFKRPGIFGLSHLGIIVVIFCIILFLRLIVSTLSQVWLGQQEKIYWKRMLILCLGPYSGVPCVVVALQYLIYDETRDFHLLTYVIGVTAMSVFFNGTLFHLVLRVLGMFEYKRATIINMNVAVGQIVACRDRAIFSQKMDLVISDANWSIVESLTRLPHPYKRKLTETGYAEDKGDFRLRTIICSSCNTEVIAPPTKGEVEDMVVEARQRVLKIQLVSFIQQYENGTINRHSYRTLFSIIDTAANSGAAPIDSAPLNIQTQEFKVTRTFRNLFSYLVATTSNNYSFVPENFFRLCAFRLTTSRAFSIIMAVLALIDTVIIARLLYIFYFTETVEGNRDFNDDDLAYGLSAQIFDFIFFFIFTLEFVINITGLGMLQYFSSHTNKIEMGANLLRATELLMYTELCIAQKRFISVFIADPLIVKMKVLLLVRVERVYVFIIGWLPRCLAIAEKQAEDELLRNYEIGKGYLVSLDRVIKFLSHIAIYGPVYDDVRKDIERERKKVAKDLGQIQKDHPSIAITVKTRHAIRFVINSMADCINDLKEDGILDLNETKAVSDSLDKVKTKLRELPMVDPALAQGVLKDITWLNEDASQCDLVFKGAKLINYDYNDRIINHGDDPVGLYVLVSGLIKAFYTPTAKSIHLNSMFGVLPNFDFFELLKFDQPQDSYVVAGNVIGELGAVTGRRYDMTVLCETSVQLYFIPWDILKILIHESSTAIDTQNSIWKSIGVRLAALLIYSKPQYSEWPTEKLLNFLNEGWVPNLNQVKCLSLIDEIAELILIEGVCRSAVSEEIFYGPCQIPKGISLLWLPDHPNWGFQTVYATRILIVPSGSHVGSIREHLFDEHKRITEEEEGVSMKLKRVGFDSEVKSVSSTGTN